MNNTAIIEFFRSKGLLPFQVKFAVDFLEQKRKRCWELVSPVGTGKTRVSTALISHQLKERPNSRCLVLAPAPLLSYWQHEVSVAEPTCDPCIIDRRTFLELEARVPVGESPWPVPAAILMSIDLAKRPDMSGRIAKVKWDLVIFDESHVLARGLRRKLFDTLKESEAFKRALLLNCLIPQSLGDAVTVIREGDVVDWDGRPVFEHAVRQLSILQYTRTDEEIRFLRETEGFAEGLKKRGVYGRLQGTTILRAVSSNIYSMETVLRRMLDVWRPMRNKLAHDVPWSEEDVKRAEMDLSTIADEPEDTEELSDGIPIDPQNFLKIYRDVEYLLDQVEKISTDAKLEALIDHLRQYFATSRNPYLCIWCSLASAVEYIVANLYDLGRPIHVITGAVKADDRAEIFEASRNTGGILITTDAAAQGVSLEYVGECVCYDLPVSPDVLEQRWGRFLRLGRKEEFQMVILVDSTNQLHWEEQILNELKSVLPSKRLE